MNALNRLSIRTRLYFGTVFSLVLLVVIGAMGYLALERTRNKIGRASCRERVLRIV